VNIVALICARGGSKGIPRKNLHPFGGRPLIEWAIDHALGVSRVRRVIVSTDSDEIAAVARHAGAEVPFTRPAHLAEDTSDEWLVWRHALAFVENDEGSLPDALLVVPVTAPLRAVQDLDRCIDEYAKGGADVVLSVTDAHRNPYFNMVKTAPDGAISLVIPPDGAVRRRQDAPPVYDVTTVGYVADPRFVLTRNRIFEGRVRHIHVPLERAIDIDSPLDLRMAECLLASR
jgi:CMP-N-acetylneuraminic acid synthetase